MYPSFIFVVNIKTFQIAKLYFKYTAFTFAARRQFGFAVIYSAANAWITDERHRSDIKEHQDDSQNLNRRSSEKAPCASRSRASGCYVFF